MPPAQRLVDRRSPDGRRKVLVLNVGGTLGMKKNIHGSYSPCSGYLTEEMHAMKELLHPTMTSYEVLEYELLLDSSDMVPADWLKIAKDIYARYDDYDGFVVAHGTDTMHYTACALSFMLHNLNKPVILTGGMVTLAEAYNDARRNLLASILLASRADELCEVCIFSNDVLLRGNRSLKVRHTMSAFDSPNYPPLATLQADGFSLRKEFLLRQPSGPFTNNSDMSGRVMMFLLHPDFDDAVFETLLLDGTTGQKLFDCIVLELMGVGSVKSNMTLSIARVVSLATKAGCIVVATTQDLAGQLTSGGIRRLHHVCPEVVFVDDMTTEAAAVKAMYLFGLGMGAEEVKKWMGLNIRGEMSKDVTVHRPHSKL